MASQKSDEVYKDAVASGLLPGVSLLAGDKMGKVLYPRSLGRASLKSGKSNEPFTASTISAIASLSKLMTSLAVLKVVEQGKLDLDADVQPMFTSTGQHDIITSLGGENNSATSEPDAKLLTLRSSWGTENGPLRLYGSYV